MGYPCPCACFSIPKESLHFLALARGCRLVLLAEHKEGEGECDSGHTVCLPCGASGHAPAVCKDAEDWSKKEANDAATVLW